MMDVAINLRRGLQVGSGLIFFDLLIKRQGRPTCRLSRVPPTSAERVDPADVTAREFLSISILENAAVLSGAVVTLRHDVTTEMMSAATRSPCRRGQSLQEGT
jgi:hypothetical protein